ncbi:MAG: DUF1080 domain-containing protein [Planctomycetes bacterium]|jgi:hypothetical protein|nr:DUF1080 domain-containing protein [Planctomycetota bacterium]
MRLVSMVCLASFATAQQPLPPAASAAEPKPLWNGTDLHGWRGLRHQDPYALAAMTEEARATLQAEDHASMRLHWRIEGSELINDGQGAYLTTADDYGDAEFALEYRTVALADSGIYLRGCPQVQIWDFTEAGGKWKLGADKGSGGLWNNEVQPRFPLVLADRPFGQWNSLRIRQLGARTWVWLNGQCTVDGAIMENYWNRKLPLPPKGPLQLQTHGGEIRFRNLTVREIPPAEANALLAAQGDVGFTPILRQADALAGDAGSCELVGDELRWLAGKGGTVHTKEVYGDFVVRFEVKLPPGGNNGLAIRYPGEGDPAYTGLEIQVLDDSAEKYATLQPWQYHGSVYGCLASHRGYQRPVGEWNFEQVTVRGSRITVELNGTIIVDGDLAGAESKLGDKHSGRLRTEGHFGLAGHGDAVAFRGLRIKAL